MSKIVGMDGKALKKDPPKQMAPDEIFNAFCTKGSSQAMENLKRAVRLPEKPTEEQKAYADTVFQQLKIVALDFYLHAIKDMEIRKQAMLKKMMDDKLNQSVLASLKNDPEGRGLKKG